MTIDDLNHLAIYILHNVKLLDDYNRQFKLSRVIYNIILFIILHLP
jgi:hypothetical protein